MRPVSWKKNYFVILWKKRVAFFQTRTSVWSAYSLRNGNKLMRAGPKAKQNKTKTKTTKVFSLIQENLTFGNSCGLENLNKPNVTKRNVLNVQRNLDFKRNLQKMIESGGCLCKAKFILMYMCVCSYVWVCVPVFMHACMCMFSSLRLNSSEKFQHGGTFPQSFSSYLMCWLFLYTWCSITAHSSGLTEKTGILMGPIFKW